ncbi:MAG: Exosome complex component Rrp42 [Candidatus Woesearchaeota archaeon]|nr:Exosome complex component Rrp42 [Candidatus Woesearchaeota archaeon]
MNKDLKAHMIEVLKQGKRFDNRKHDEFRDIKIEKGVVKTAEGSARVSVGGTTVLAGIKLSIGSPYPDRPEEGTIITNVELSPMANPEFESGRPGIDSVEMSRVVDRGIRESKAIDLKGLGIDKGESCWLVNIDVVAINDEGNIKDAASLAALAALTDTKFPEVKDGTINYKKKTKKGLDLSKQPISVTVLKIGDDFIVDPTIQEERAIDARLTVSTLKNKSICALQKGEESPLSFDDVQKMVDLGVKTGAKIRKKVK